MQKCNNYFKENQIYSHAKILTAYATNVAIFYEKNKIILAHANSEAFETYVTFLAAKMDVFLLIRQYAIPKIKMLRNLSCFETRFRLLCR